MNTEERSIKESSTKPLLTTEDSLTRKLQHVPLDHEFEQMLISAERYACGRMSYIVSDTIEYLTPLLPVLSDWCLSVMSHDIAEEAAMCERSGGKIKMGMDCDHEAWLRLKANIDEELNRRHHKLS